MRGLLNVDKAVFPNENAFSFPEIPAFDTKVCCDSWSDFDCAVGRKQLPDGVHFYISDYKFERLWKNPDKYIPFLHGFDYVVQPDFSLYYDFPIALQIYNKFRNHWLARYLCQAGVPVIPNVSPSCPWCYEWSFLGYPKRSVVAFSDIGCVRDSRARLLCQVSFDRMLYELEPIQVLYFTRSEEHAPEGVTVVKIPIERR